jgi:uncharacterized paraquat-inducible protein A
MAKIGCSAMEFRVEFACLPQADQRLIEAVYPGYPMVAEHARPGLVTRLFVRPTTLIRRFIRIAQETGHQEWLQVCPRCHGTGEYQGPTRIRDSRGRPFCLRCRGAGVSLKALKPAQQRELQRLYLERWGVEGDGTLAV